MIIAENIIIMKIVKTEYVSKCIYLLHIWSGLILFKRTGEMKNTTKKNTKLIKHLSTI